MHRHTFALKLKPGQADEFRLGLRLVWETLTAALDRAGADNFSMWNARDLVFGYMEFPGGRPESGEYPGMIYLKTFLNEGLPSAHRDLFDWLSDPEKPMRLMYSNIGIIRHNKELIRHRVFMTELKEGSEDEYRRRHKALEELRGDSPDPGPDSNFTIWSAGGYIFGYDEIDTTMEKEMTRETRADTIAWERKMLEIMVWITDDVDWITGDHHAHVRRLAWHN